MKINIGHCSFHARVALKTIDIEPEEGIKAEDKTNEINDPALVSNNASVSLREIS